MKNVNKLLDEVKAKAGIDSNNGIAAILGVRRQRVTNYYKGERVPDNFVCKRISEYLNKPLEEVITAVEIDAEKDEKKRGEWLEYYKSIGGYAAAFMLVIFCFVTFIVTSAEVVAKESTTYKEQMTRNTNYASIRKKIKRLISSARHTLYNVFPRFCFAS